MNHHGLSRRVRGVSWPGFLFLIMVMAIFVMARQLSNREKIKAKKYFTAQMSDPRTMVRLYLIESSINHDYKSDRWGKIIGFMSNDDQSWFEENFRLIASMNRYMEGHISMAVTEREQRFGAMQVLTGFDRNGKKNRPLVSTIELNDPYGVVFIHHPGRPDTLRPIFIIREGKQWKIRRFGGSRDETRIAHGIAEARNLKDLPLSKDERAILENPRRYKEGKRTEMMAQCGIHEQ